MTFNIEEELKKLPAQPGVYIMHDATDQIIYVGKAISLTNRVHQYFQSSRNKTAKIQKMVSKIAWFEYIVTDSELEALVLECNLIKEHQPRYNTMLKDDKAYPYIKVTVTEDFPRVLFARTMKKDKNKYFGPYTSAGAVKDSLELIHKLYRIRTGRKILGVCGGLANYFDIDPTIVRVVFALIGLFWGAGILAYFIMALVIPENPYEIVD